MQIMRKSISISQYSSCAWNTSTKRWTINVNLRKATPSLSSRLQLKQKERILSRSANYVRSFCRQFVNVVCVTKAMPTALYLPLQSLCTWINFMMMTMTILIIFLLSSAFNAIPLAMFRIRMERVLCMFHRTINFNSFEQIVINHIITLVPRSFRMMICVPAIRRYARKK